jgi:DNA-binding NarL/FixJ family response regulator
VNCFVVDDHPLVQEGLESCLQKINPHMQIVGTWKTSRGAAEAILEKNPEIVFLDHYLPDGTGLDVIHQLQNNFPVQNIIVMSRLSSALLLKKYMDSGVRAILSKSSEAESIRRALKVMPASKTFICNQYSLLAKELPHIDQLTSRELEVIQCIVEGKTNKEAGQKLNCSEFTVKTHKAAVYRSHGKRISFPNRSGNNFLSIQ